MTHRCPDEETLAAYFDGLMPAEDEAILQAEMIQCPDCTRLVAALGLVIEAEEPDAWRSASVPAAITQAAMDLWPAEPNPVTEGLRVAARWLGEALQPLADALAPMQLAGGLVRGAAAIAEEELRYTVNVGDIPLQLDLEVDGPRQIALSVRPLEAPPPGLLLRVLAGAETRALSTLTAEGTTVAALPVGTYTLSLEKGGDPLGTLELSLESD